MSDLKSVSLQLNALTVYRVVLQDETIARFARVLNAAQGGSASAFCESYGAFLQQLSDQTGSFDLAGHIEQRIRYDDNAFTRASAQGGRSEGYLALRKAAMFDLDAIRGVVTTMIQTERYGTPLASALRVLSAEFRNQRMMRAEEKAARLPAIMTIPLILFILPTLFVVILGPAACSIVDAFGGGGPGHNG